MGKTIRPNGTVRTPVGSEFKKCYICNIEKDVTKFHSRWYQPQRNGKPYGDKERRRANRCKECANK